MTSYKLKHVVKGNVNTVHGCAKWDELLKFLHLSLSRTDRQN